MKNLITLTLLSFTFVFSCKNDQKMNETSTSLKAPIAKKIPKTLTIHNDQRIDDYYWLNQREDKDVLNYLTEENNYTEAVLKPTEAFQKSLFEEMKSRIKEDDQSVPYKFNGYWYITKFEEGKDYPIYTRKKETLDAKEEILFDCNLLAKDHAYFKLGGFSVSEDNTLATFSVDTVSRRQYTIFVKNLITGEVYNDKIENTTGSSTWASDNKTIFYAKKDPVTLRSDKIFRHQLGDSSDNDKLVFEEKDDTFYTYVYKSKSRKYIIIGSSSTQTSEYQILPANQPTNQFKVFQPRVRDLEYSIAHYNDSFYIITNKDKATNFKVQKTNENSTLKENWVDVIPHRQDVLIEDIEIFKDYLVVNERKNGLNQLRIISWDKKEDYYLDFKSETYTANIGNNPDFDSQFLRYTFNSLTNPSSVIDYNFKTKEKTVKKEQEVLDSNFDKNNYTSKRVWATARDGVKVPMSIVYKKGIKLDGTNF